jgi:hypothetical protein
MSKTLILKRYPRIVYRMERISGGPDQAPAAERGKA